MIFWNELYKDFLFKDEDEYILFGLLIPDMFWEKNNDIEHHYKSLFKTKIEAALKNTYSRLAQEKYNFEELLVAVADDYGTRERDSSNQILSKLDMQFEHYLFRIFENDFTYTSEENLRYPSLPIEEIAEIIVRVFGNRLEEFSSRLKILQMENNILDYYNSSEIIENIDENNFPKQEELRNLDFIFYDISNLAYFL